METIGKNVQARPTVMDTAAANKDTAMGIITLI
jgi:hypothetical protein